MVINYVENGRAMEGAQGNVNVNSYTSYQIGTEVFLVSEEGPGG